MITTKSVNLAVLRSSFAHSLALGGLLFSTTLMSACTAEDGADSGTLVISSQDSSNGAFGEVAVGTTVTKTFTVLNDTNETLGFNLAWNLGLTGPMSRGAGGTCGDAVALAPSASCTLQVKFAPTEAKAASEELTINTTTHSNASATPKTASLSLTGTGTAGPGSTPTLPSGQVYYITDLSTNTMIVVDSAGKKLPHSGNFPDMNKPFNVVYDTGTNQIYVSNLAIDYSAAWIPTLSTYLTIYDREGNLLKTVANANGPSWNGYMSFNPTLKSIYNVSTCFHDGSYLCSSGSSGHNNVPQPRGVDVMDMNGAHTGFTDLSGTIPAGSALQGVAFSPATNLTYVFYQLWSGDYSEHVVTLSSDGSVVSDVALANTGGTPQTSSSKGYYVGPSFTPWVVANAGGKDRLYGIGYVQGLAVYDPTTGAALNSPGGFAGVSTPTGLHVSPDGKHIIVVMCESKAVTYDLDGNPTSEFDFSAATSGYYTCHPLTDIVTNQ